MLHWVLLNCQTKTPINKSQTSTTCYKPPKYTKTTKQQRGWETFKCLCSSMPNKHITSSASHESSRLLFSSVPKEMGWIFTYVEGHIWAHFSGSSHNCKCVQKANNLLSFTHVFCALCTDVYPPSLLTGCNTPQLTFMMRVVEVKKCRPILQPIALLRLTRGYGCLAFIPHLLKDNVQRACPYQKPHGESTPGTHKLHCFKLYGICGHTNKITTLAYMELCGKKDSSENETSKAFAGCHFACWSPILSISTKHYQAHWLSKITQRNVHLPVQSPMRLTYNKTQRVTWQ